MQGGAVKVVRPGLEPGLFWTKTRRVANYTIGQFCGAKLGRAVLKIKKFLLFFPFFLDYP